MITLREEKGTQLTHQEMDENFKSVMGGHNFLHIQDQKTQGTQGGTFTSGAWQTRDLNTVLTNTITGASLSNNQITLPAGKYYIEASAPGRGVLNHKARLYNNTDSSQLLLGRQHQSHRVSSGSVSSTDSIVVGIFQINAEKNIILHHYCTSAESDAGFGFGGATNISGIEEVYSDIRIWRIGEYIAP